MTKYWTPRQWLERRANTEGYSDKTRKEARALLNVVGDDWALDSRFVGQQKYDAPGITRKTDGGFLGIGAKDHGNYSNGYSVYQVQSFLPELKQAYLADYNVWKNDPNVMANSSDNNSSAYDPYAAARAAQAAQARQTAQNIRLLEEKLGLMPGQLSRIDQAERNKYAHIDNDYNRANSSLDTYWKQTEEDYNRARGQRLADRRRQIGVADDDFKKQNDAYARYFSRTGSGSSSAAQYTVPQLLARATQKIRNDIESNNAELAQTQDTNFSRANLDYKKEKDNILTARERQKQEAKEYFAGKRANHWDEVANLEREKANAQNRSTADIIAAGAEAIRKAQQYADEAVAAGGVTDGIKFKPIEYETPEAKDWTYDPTETKIENPEQEDDNTLYEKYFRDKEDEEKKKKGWISATAA